MTGPAHIYVQRFGPRQYDKATEYARDNAGDGSNVTHVVEVFDEETVRNEREDVDMGPLYVVEDAHLADFLASHDGDASVQETYGYNPEEE